MKALLPFILIILLSILYSCSNKVIDFDMEYDNLQKISYGDTVNLKFINITSDNKKKDFWFNHYNDLSTIVKGGELIKDKLVIQSRPKSFDYQSVEIIAEYDTKNKGILNKKFEIPLNFKGPTVLNFSGKHGEDRKARRDLSGSKLLGRNGRNGNDGWEGEPGGNGKNLEVKIWKPYSDSGFVFMQITNIDSTTEQYKYRYLLNGQPIRIQSNGGNGGAGGDGGDGGDGQDGEVKKGDKKEPGNGGNGGDGGNGGKGGDSGFITVYVHENAKAVLGTIHLETNGGTGGKPGKGGKPGNPGTPLEGQEEGTIGNAGISGQPGAKGLSLNSSNIKVESFNIPNN